MSNDDEIEKSRLRRQIYWAMSGTATLIFSAFVYLMMMVPGIPASQKLYMLFIAAVLLVLPLLVAAWKFSSTDAPLMSWPFGPLVSVVLLIELAWCLAGFVEILTHRR